MNYGGTQPPGPIARYARGDDYHDVMRAKLDEFGRWFVAECNGDARTRSFVDTGPVLERDLARRAGLGWFGKNTNLINPGLGSFFFIGALFTDAELEIDAPFEADRCGTLHALPRRVPDAGVHRPARARRDALHLLPHDRAQGRDPARDSGRPSASCSTAATSARTSARGTASFSRELIGARLRGARTAQR